MLHRRWSHKVALPVGPLWGNTGERGVAGCMTWDQGYDKGVQELQEEMDDVNLNRYPKDVEVHTKYPKTKHPKYQQNRSQWSTSNNNYGKAMVKYEPKLEDTYSSRSSGALQVRPPTGTHYDKDKKYYYTSTSGTSSRGGRDVMRETSAHDVPFVEDIAIRAVRGYVDNEKDLMLRKPPKPPNSVRKNTSRTTVQSHRGRKVEFRDGGGSTKRVMTPNGYPSARARANDEMGRWQNAVDDLLLQRAEDDLMVEPYTGHPASILKNGDMRPDYFDLWKNTVSPRVAQTTPIPTPVLSTNRSGYTDDLDPDQRKWLMSQYRRSAKPRVDTHWESDPYQNTKARPESRIKVNLDCPPDSDMTVSVKLHNNKVWRY